MKLLAIFFLAALAMGGATDCDDSTVETRVEGCLDTLLGSLLGDTSEEEVCKELSDAIDCLRSLVDDCAAEDEEAEEGLKELETLLTDNCKDGGNIEGIDDKTGECLVENMEYLFDCLTDAPEQAVPILLASGMTDQNELTCALYAVMGECFVERAEEKCGEEAGKQAREELDDAPQEIVDACAAVGELDITDIDLLDRKRK